LPNPTSRCSNVFYVCSNGIATEQICPKGLFFDPLTQACDLEEYVCLGQPRTSSTAFVQRDFFTTPAPEFPCKDKADGSYGDLSLVCSAHFFVCSGGATHKQNCPGKLKFDAASGICMKELDIFACTNKIRPTNPPNRFHDVEAATFPPIPFDCQTDGDFADPQQPCSNSYYSCFGGVGIQRQCPPDTFYDAQTQMCDMAMMIPACSGSPRPVISGSSGLVSPPPSFDAQRPSVFPPSGPLQPVSSLPALQPTLFKKVLLPIVDPAAVQPPFFNF